MLDEHDHAKSKLQMQIDQKDIELKKLLDYQGAAA